MAPVAHRTADVDGFKAFYREAGQADTPKLLLLHGFPTAGHLFRDVIPMLADRFHLIAPDLPGFGQSSTSAREQLSYTFVNIASVIERFTEVIGFYRFAVYVFDYGAPTGFRLAVRYPERSTAIISQDGNACEEGLSDDWNPIQAYWQDLSQANRNARRAFLIRDTTRWQYTHVFPTRRWRRRMVKTSITFIWPVRRRGGATRSVRRLQEQCRALSVISGILPHAQAAAPGGMGQERPILLAAWRRCVQARQP
jgi:pimeloyl-ACP methyl ester carboxylesterase